MSNEVTPEFLDAFGDAFNRHDVDAILKMMTEDCVFESYAGLTLAERVSWGQSKYAPA